MTPDNAYTILTEETKTEAFEAAYWRREIASQAMCAALSGGIYNAETVTPETLINAAIAWADLLLLRLKETEIKA